MEKKKRVKWVVDRIHTKQKPIKSSPRAISIAAKETEKSKCEKTCVSRFRTTAKISYRRCRRRMYVYCVCGFAITPMPSHVCSIPRYMKMAKKSAKAKRRKTFQSFLRGIKRNGDFLPCFSLTTDSLFYVFFVFDSIFADMFIVYCVDDGGFSRRVHMRSAMRFGKYVRFLWCRACGWGK